MIHPGVDLDRWSLPDPPPGPPRALCLGALVPWKRADLALEIAARVPELALELAGAPLAGDPPGFVAALHERAARPDLAGRVRFLGALDDPRLALARANCLLHCADREPYGLALVEALAAGRPVVAPAAGGPLEIVTPGSGRLYRPATPAPAPPLSGRCSPTPAPARGRPRARAAAFDGARGRAPLRRARRPARRADVTATRRLVPAGAALASTSLARHASRRARRRGGLPALRPDRPGVLLRRLLRRAAAARRDRLWALVLALASPARRRCRARCRAGWCSPGSPR